MRLSFVFHRQLSSTLMHFHATLSSFKFWWELMRVFATRAVISTQLSSTLMQLLFLFGSGHESWENFHANSRLPTLINSCSPLTGAWELRKLSCKLSLLNSHQLSCNTCSRLTGAWELRKLSCKLLLLNSHASLVLVWPGHESWENSHVNKLSLANSHQLSCNSCSRLTGAWVERWWNSHLQTLVFSHFRLTRS
jgi:hypothetical protein